MPNLRWRTLFGLIGAGVLLGTFGFRGCSSSFSGNIRSTMPIGKYENLVITQVDRKFTRDSYLIQNPYDANRTESIDQYIKNKFGNKFDRKMERLKLEKVVDQYKH